MKATGIVRRIDDLGRVVIPKEIRRTLRLREGTPLEIFTDREGEIILKKYSPMVELAAFAVQYAEAMAQSTGLMVCIADRDQIIAVSGGPKKEYYQKTISRALELAVSERQNICAARGEKAFIPITSDEVEESSAEVIVPILSEGDAIGAVILLSREAKQALTATAYVAEGTDLKAVTVTSLKLGPADITTYSPTAEELSATGFETVRLVDVTCHGRTERWMLHVQPTNVKIGIRDIDLWNNTAVVTTMVTPEDYATAEVQYRLKGTADWQTTQKGAQDESGIFTSTIAPEWTSLTNDAGIPVKRLVTTKGFYAGQTYEFRLLVGGEETETAEYTAPAGDTIPDANMENPGLSCFTSENTNAEFWASGNNTFADKLCRQGTFNGMGGSYCAKLAAAAPPLVNIAAGNLMSGIFYKDGLWTGVVEFGQPYNWTARPSGMKVKYHATLGTIDASKHSGAPVGIGDPDKARIFVAIIDWNARHRVASGTKDPTGIWDPAETTQTAEGKLIAYGSLFIDKSTEGGQMVEATLPLNFYDPAAARPTGKYSVIISCSTSAYGDYMVGCTTNVMYVDDFQWVY